MDAYDPSGQSMMLAGPSRAAVLMLALGPAGAGRLLKHFSPEDIRALRQGAADQPPVSPQALDALVSEFQEAFQAGPGISAMEREMQKLLEEVIPEEDLSRILADTQAPMRTEAPTQTWPRLEEQGAETLRDLLGAEHPQVAAIVLSRLSAETAALVVSGFEAAIRNDVLTRMLVARPLTPMAETLFETSLREVHLVTNERANRSARHVGFAEIVNRMDKTQADDLLETIGLTQPDDCAAVRRLLFAFEDLPSLARRSLLVLFDEVPTEMVTTALVDVDPELREAVLSSLAARARRMVEAELSQPREIDPREILSARRAIAALALRLSNEGRIALPSPGQG